MSTARVAALQMVSGSSVADNLALAHALIADAARQGARLAVLPEVFACSDGAQAQALGEAECDGSGPLRIFLAQAAKTHSLWLVGGTIPIAQNGSRPHAACLVFSPRGEEVARYDKMHLFDVELPDTQRSYRESDRYTAGNTAVSCATELGLLGLSVCYDLRFPELFRLLCQRGATVLTVPSAFTRHTGAAHWHVLLRARAIENQAYVIAPNQGGVHSAQRETWGGSAIIDPWGRVLASAATGAQVLCADIDPAVLADIRLRIPVGSHQRFYVPEEPADNSSSRR